MFNWLKNKFSKKTQKDIVHAPPVQQILDALLDVDRWLVREQNFPFRHSTEFTDTATSFCFKIYTCYWFANTTCYEYGDTLNWATSVEKEVIRKACEKYELNKKRKQQNKKRQSVIDMFNNVTCSQNVNTTVNVNKGEA